MNEESLTFHDFGPVTRTYRKPTTASYLNALLASVHEELNRLSRTRPQEHLTETRVQIINSTLRKTKRFLESYVYGDILPVADDSLTYSDALVLVGQYRAALQCFRMTAWARVRFR